MTSSGFDASSRRHVFWCPSVHRPNDSKVHHTTYSCTTQACRFSRESHDNISISPSLILCPPRFPARKISKNSSILCLHLDPLPYPLLCMTFLMNVDDIRLPENETKRNRTADEHKLYIHTAHAMTTRVPYIYTRTHSERTWHVVEYMHCTTIIPLAWVPMFHQWYPLHST